MKADTYQIITDAIINKLDNGVIPWKRPWKRTESPRNLLSKRPYSGLNVMLLAMQGYSSPYWLTFKQASSLGGKVKKGEKGTPIIFWNMAQSKKEEGKVIPFLKHFTVFNIDQCEGLAAPTPDNQDSEPLEFKPVERAEEIIQGYQEGPKIEHQGSIACYIPSLDAVKMPKKTDFLSIDGYYSTLFHELTHSTGHKGRLKREGVTEPTKFGSHRYSKEELVAELGACFLCSESEIVPDLEQSTAYIQSWIKVLSNDKKLIVTASTQATKAVNHILGRVKDENIKQG